MYRAIFFMLFFSQTCYGQQKLVCGCNGYGFFAEFLWTLNYLDFCLAKDLTPVVYWDGRFAYHSNEGYNGNTNAWEYYFEPVSFAQYEEGDYIHLPYQRANHLGIPSIFWDYHEIVNYIWMSLLKIN